MSYLFPAPILTAGQTFVIATDTINGSITITGAWFTPNTRVSIDNVTVNSVTFVSPNEITLDITTGSTEHADNDITVNNGKISTLADAVQVIQSNWIDLRLNGEVLSIGNGAGNDVRHHPDMVVSRDSDGLYMASTTASTYANWIKFENLGFLRSAQSDVHIVAKSNTGFVMLGIGSDATNETSTAQYAQAEALNYQSGISAIFHWGNSGTPGVGANVNIADVSFAGYDWYKIIIKIIGRPR